MKYTYFKNSEVEGLDIQFVMLLDAARAAAGIPFIITSGLRSEKHNAEVGGVNNSAHTRGLAVDLRIKDNNERFKITDALLKTGFNRIGHYADHLHVDADASLPQSVMWVL